MIRAAGAAAPPLTSFLRMPPLSDKKQLQATEDEIRQISENPQDYIDIFHMSLDMI